MRTGAVLFTCLLAAAGPARAGESLFSRAYTTDTMPEDRWQVIQEVRDRRGRAFGRYDARDLRTRLEYGLGDTLQLAFNTTLISLDASGAPDDDLAYRAGTLKSRTTGLQSLSLEFLYRAASPVTDPVGLAFAIEPILEYRDFHNARKLRGSWVLRARAILQMDFLDDRLAVVFNTFLDDESEQNVGVKEDRVSELDWSSELAATMRVAAHWSLGAEARNHNDYLDFHRNENSTYWAGPVVHYGAQRFWATLGVLWQAYGTPSGSGGLYLRKNERSEATLKLALPF